MDSSAVPYENGVLSELQSKLTFKWTIQNFPETHKDMGKDECLISPTFRSIGSKCNYHIKLFPHAGRVKFLIEYHKKAGVTASIRITLHASKVNSKYSYDFNENQLVRDPGVSSSSLMSESYGFFINGLLTITCEIEEQISYRNIYTEIENERRLLDFNTFEQIFQNSEQSDIVLDVGGEKLLAHKCILLTRSPVFGAMFKHDMEEKQNNVVKIEDIKPNVMKELLRFVYVGKVENIDQMASDLYLAADKYALEGLKVICEDFMCENIILTNFMERFNFAVLHGARKLMSSVFDFIALHQESLKLIKLT